MIQANRLTKWYGPTLAVDDLSLEIPRGRIVGFLGPNGAGKSTTIRMLTGFLPPTSGSASINGNDVLKASAAARADIGYLPEGNALYTEMRVTEYLHYRGSLYGMPRKQRVARINTVCDRCGLSHNKRKTIGALSKGNRQRVGLAQALLNEPPVLILDEPTAGLDPNQINEVRKLISELRDKHTVLLSSHILPEIEKTADTVIIIAGGKKVAEGSPGELRKKVISGARLILEARADSVDLVTTLESLDAVAEAEAETFEAWCRVIVTPKDKTNISEIVGEACLVNGWPVREMSFESASLEQFFTEVTGDASTKRTGAA